MIDNFYSKKFIELIQDKFNIEQHQFIILRYKGSERYLNERDYKNIVVCELSQNIVMRLLNYKYLKIRNVMKKADFLFIHYMNDEIIGLLFGFKANVKLIWIIWGADLYNYIPIKLYDEYTLELIKSLDGKIEWTRKKLFFFIKFKLRKYVVKKISYVISAHEGDIILLNKYFKTNAKWYPKVMYPNPVDFDKLEKANSYRLDIENKLTKNGSKLILIGNSGFPSNNHLDILLRLSKMELQNFKILCPLSYGPPNYIKKIVANGKKLFGDRFIPLLEFLNPDAYSNILKQVDIVIMYHNRQQGVGTMRILFALGKPICVKKTSTYFYFTKKGFTIFSSDVIEDLILDKIEFTKELVEQNKQIISDESSTESNISSTERLFNYLKHNKSD